MSSAVLIPNITPGARIGETGVTALRLEIPAGPAGQYRLAQLDDTARLPRSQFIHRPPVSLRLEGRASAAELPGTWGFGFWNDPFSFSLGLGGGTRRLPALPRAAWFFFASRQNYLSLRDDLPAHGALAAGFASPAWPSLLLAPGAVFLPLMVFRPLARVARRLLRRLIPQTAAMLDVSVTEWHRYEIQWQLGRLVFRVDEHTVLDTRLSPAGPLGLVIWIDNQYAAFPADGRLSYGMLATPAPSWIELRDLTLNGDVLTIPTPYPRTPSPDAHPVA
jgi:hypothetical protein